MSSKDVLHAQLQFENVSWWSISSKALHCYFEATKGTHKKGAQYEMNSARLLNEERRKVYPKNTSFDILFQRIYKSQHSTRAWKKEYNRR